jgi:VCBS repeat-containing protein
MIPLGGNPLPNEIKNHPDSFSNPASSRKLAALGSSGSTAMVWTLSGMVLAACGAHGGQIIHGGNGLPIPDPSSLFSGAFKGPLKGAVLYFDSNRDGMIDTADRTWDPANPRANSNFDEFGNARWVTGENGMAPGAPQGMFIADISNAIDVQSRQTFSAGDELRSLPSGGIATPITDVIAEMFYTPGATPPTETQIQGFIDTLFPGTERPEITLADILNLANYNTGEDPVETDPMAVSGYDTTRHMQYLIERAALGLEEATGTVTQRIAAVSELVDDDPDTVSAANTALMMAVDDDEATAMATARGVPVAAPAGGINIDEDTGAPGDGFTLQELASANRHTVKSLFFTDTKNADAARTFDSHGGIAFNVASLTNFKVLFDTDGDPATDNDLAADQGTRPSNPPTPTGTFWYVSASELSKLTLKIDANFFSASHASNMPLELDYFVYDGERWTDTETLRIAVNPVNDAPVIAQDSYSFRVVNFVRANDAVGAAITHTDVEGDTVTYALSGAGSQFFDISSTGQITRSSQGTIAVGQMFNLTVTATDTGGARDTASVTIEVIANRPAETVTLQGTQTLPDVDENTDITGTGLEVATLRVVDMDGGPHTLTLSGTHAHLFAIDEASSTAVANMANTYDVKLYLRSENEKLNYDTPTPTTMLSVSIIGSDGTASPVNINVTLNDVNEIPTTNPTTTIQIDESAANAYRIDVADFGYADEDGDPFHSMTITSLPSPSSGRLQLVSTTIVLTGGMFHVDTANLVNLRFIPAEGKTNSTASFDYYVSDGVANSATATFNIAVTADNDAPVFAQSAYTFSITDSHTTGVVGTAISATDPEGDPYTFSISDGDFEIDASSGEITLKTGTTLVGGATHNLTVTATETADPNSRSMVTVTVNVTRNTAPTIKYNDDETAKAVDITEGSTAATTQWSVLLADPDTADTVESLTARAMATSSTTGVPSTPTYASIDVAMKPDGRGGLVADTDGTDRDLDIPVPTGPNGVAVYGTYGMFTLTRGSSSMAGELSVEYKLFTAAQLKTQYDLVQALNTNETLQDKLTVYAHDGKNESTPLTYTVTIEGETNITPTITWAAMATGGPTISGNIATFTYGDGGTNPIPNTGVTDPVAQTFNIADANTSDRVLDLFVRGKIETGTSNPLNLTKTDYGMARNDVGAGPPSTSIFGTYGDFILTRDATGAILTVTYEFDEGLFGAGGTNPLTADVYEELNIFVSDGQDPTDPLIYTIHIDVA